MRGYIVEIKEENKDFAIEFVKKYHYSKIMPRIMKHFLGFYENDELLGIVILGWGTQPLQTIKKIFYKDEVTTTDYAEISKMCFLPKVNNNKSFGSQCISCLVKWLKQNTSYKFLYTMADGIMGKCGYVYQASNFIYLGSFKTSVYLDINTGEKIHPRSAKLLLKENAEFDGVEKRFWLTDNFCKYKGIDKIQGLMFRYIMPLNKQGKKILNKYDEYKNLERPKDKDLLFERRIYNGKFEKINQPNFNMSIFNYNYQNKKRRDA